MPPVKRLRALQEERALAVREMEAIITEAGDGDLTEEQQKTFDGLESKTKSLDSQIARVQRVIEAARTLPVEPDDDDQPLPDDAVRVKGDNWQNDPMCGFERPRDFLLEVIEVGQGAQPSPQLRYLAAAGSDEQSGQHDAYGNFFIPVGMSPDVLSVGMENDPTTGRVTPIPMQTPVLQFNARVDKNHTTSVTGGLVVTRRAETQQPGSSRMEHERVKLEVSGQWGLAYVTEQLLERSPVSFVALLEAGFRDEYASEGLKERIRGIGVGEPLGVLNAPATIAVAKESGQTADTINSTNVVKMRKRVWRYSNAIWIANHDTYDQLISLHIEGTNGDVFIFNPSRGEDAPDMLLGRPIFFSEYASKTGDLGDIMVCNWSQYLWGTLGPANPRRAESIHVRFLNHERTFKFWIENDGRPWWMSALTPNQSAETLSPFVTLAERA